jgi:hypothetical protein
MNEDYRDIEVPTPPAIPDVWVYRCMSVKGKGERGFGHYFLNTYFLA